MNWDTLEALSVAFVFFAFVGLLSALIGRA